MEFAFNNIYIGSTMLFTFGWTFALFTVLAGLGVYGITLLHKMNKPYREKSREVGEKTNTMLSEIFNNIKMIKLYGWQDLFAKRMTENRAEEFELDNQIDKFGHSVGKINGMIRTAFPTLNLCLYVWMGNTFNVGFAIIMMDYFNRIFNSYNFFPHFLNWMADRWTYEELSTKMMNVPDM